MWPRLPKRVSVLGLTLLHFGDIMAASHENFCEVIHSTGFAGAQEKIPGGFSSPVEAETRRSFLEWRLAWPKEQYSSWTTRRT